MRWRILLLVFLYSGCASDGALMEMNRKQAATIDALNQEISRLNVELDRSAHVPQPHRARMITSSSPAPYEK